MIVYQWYSLMHICKFLHVCNKLTLENLSLKKSYWETEWFSRNPHKNKTVTKSLNNMTKSLESIRVTVACGILPLKRECTYSNYLVITFEEFNLKQKKKTTGLLNPGM